jgi:ABC-type Na+ efflux pump permease subunit
MWGWLAVVISFYSVALGNSMSYSSDLNGIQAAVVLMFLFSIAMSAAGSFRRERETGLLELMLVTPLRVGQIVNGRLRALWGQFLPASILFVTLWVCIVRESDYFGMSTGSLDDQMIWLCLFCSSALTLPAVGLWCSLHCRFFIVSLFGTVTVGFLLPVLAVGAVRKWMDHGHAALNMLLLPALLGGLLWGLAWRRPLLRDYTGALLAPILAASSAVLALILITNRNDARWIEEQFEKVPGVLCIMALQLTIAVILLISLHRALVRRKFAFPQ